MESYGGYKRQFGNYLGRGQNELWGLSVIRRQLWNAIRGLDVRASVPDVGR